MSSTAPASARRSPPTRSTAPAPRCAPTRRWRATPASTTAPTCSRSARPWFPSRRRRRSSTPGSRTPMGEARYIRRLAKIRALEKMSVTDYRRVIELILEELARAGAVAPTRCACHGFTLECCPDRVQRVLDAGATRLGLHASDGGASGVSGYIDHTLLKPDATASEIETTLPRSRRVEVRHRLREPDVGRAGRAGDCAARRRCVLRRRVPARRDHAGRQAVRGAARDLRRRLRDRHGDQRRRAQVRRRAPRHRRHSRRRLRVPRGRRRQQGDHRNRRCSPTKRRSRRARCRKPRAPTS